MPREVVSGWGPVTTSSKYMKLDRQKDVKGMNKHMEAGGEFAQGVNLEANDLPALRLQSHKQYYMPTTILVL